MENVTIYMYGYSYYMFQILNGIAMFQDSGAYTVMVNALSMIVASYYALQMGFNSGKVPVGHFLLKIIGTITLVNALLLPTTAMLIKDHVRKTIYKVDNIPLAFALPIGMIESMGHIFTLVSEQAFAPIVGKSSFDYYNHGTLFGARLAKEVSQAKIRDPEFISNMRHFIERCIIMPAMIGSKFTKEELVASKDMWGLVTKNAGTLRRMSLINNGKRSLPTCKEAVPYFDKKMQDQIEYNITNISIKLNTAGKDMAYVAPNQSQAHNKLNDTLRTQINALYNNNASVENILKHNMMINAFNQYRAAKYPAVRAQMQNESGGFISGALADRILTTTLAAFKSLIYSSFIFIVPMMIFAGGMAKYRGWITTCLSLQLWPSLYAILNMMIEVAYDPMEIVSFSSWSSVTQRMDSMASVAAGLSLMIPFLAIYIMRVGEGGLLHLAGSLMASASNASAAAASEHAVGGRNYDNSSIGNISRNNVNSNKYNTLSQFVSAGSMRAMGDGSVEHVTPSGNTHVASGPGYTAGSGETNFSGTEAVNASLHRGLSNAEETHNSNTANLSMAKENAINSQVAFLKNIADSTRTENGYNINDNTAAGREVINILNSIDTLGEDDSTNWAQNASTVLTAKGGLDAGTLMAFAARSASINPVLGAGLTGAAGLAKAFDLHAGVAFDASASHNNQQEDSHSARMEDGHNIQDTDSNRIEIVDHEAYLKSIGVDQSLQESATESYNEMMRLEKLQSISQNKINSYNEAIDYTKNSNTEMRIDYRQKVIDEYQKRYNTSAIDAAKAADRGGLAIEEIFAHVVEGDVHDIMHRIEKGQENISSSNTVNEFIDHNHNKINVNIGADDGHVKQTAKNNNMINEIKAKEAIQNSKEKLAIYHENLQNANQDAIDNQGAINRKKQKTLQGYVDDNNKKRWSLVGRPDRDK